MNDSIRFTVLAVDGSFFDVGELGTDSLRFDELTWDNAVDLARLSFAQGFQIIIWQAEDNLADN